MSEVDQPFGFWIRIVDEDSARYAARMSGLPVLLAGLAAAVIYFFETSLAFQMGLANLVIAGLFVVMGLAIRAGWFGFIPFAAVFMIVSLLAGIYASSLLIYGLAQAGGVPIELVTVELIRAVAFPILFSP